jgi:hypothetical protein
MRHLEWGWAVGAVAMIAVGWPLQGWAATDAQKCEAKKLQTAGKYYACREHAEAKAAKKGAAPDYGKCEAKFAKKWDAAETKGAGACPDNVTTTAMDTHIVGQATQTAMIIAGTQGIPTCGDGVIDLPGEHCDGADLGGADCTTLAYDLGTLGCSGSCVFDATACARCPSGSTPFAGTCWVLGAVPNSEGVGSCDTACAAIGATCNQAALQAVGSGGTDDDCRQALDAADPGGAPHPISAFSPEDNTFCGLPSDYAGGCVFVEGFGVGNDGAERKIHDASGTLCEADFVGGGCSTPTRRVCACDP